MVFINKIKNKIIASLCALGCTFSNSTKNTNAEMEPETRQLIIGAVVPIVGIFLTGIVTYYFSKRDQRKMDAERLKEIKKSNFKFDDLDVDIVREKLTEVADIYPYAQEQCEIIIDFICGCIKAKQEDPYANLPVLSLDGIPGCGKTSMLKKMLYAIGLDPVIISPTDIDKGNKKISSTQQTYGRWTSRAGDHFIQVDAPLTKALKTNKNYTCVLFDDADKFDPEVIQGFWNIADGGKIKSGDNYIDTTKLFTFVTSNKSLHMTADKMVEEKSANVDKEWAKAIKSRFMCLTIPQPRKIDYITKLNELLFELASYYPDIELMIGDDVIDQISDTFVKNGKCMRNINECKIYLTGALSRMRSKGIGAVELKLVDGFVRLVEYVKKDDAISDEIANYGDTKEKIAKHVEVAKNDNTKEKIDKHVKIAKNDNTKQKISEQIETAKYDDTKEKIARNNDLELRENFGGLVRG